MLGLAYQFRHWVIYADKERLIVFWPLLMFLRNTLPFRLFARCFGTICSCCACPGNSRTWSARVWVLWSSFGIGRLLFSPAVLSSRAVGRPLFVQIAGSWPARIRDAPRVVPLGFSWALAPFGAFPSWVFFLGSVLVISKRCRKVLSSVRGWGVILASDAAGCRGPATSSSGTGPSPPRRPASHRFLGSLPSCRRQAPMVSNFRGCCPRVVLCRHPWVDPD